MDRAYLVLCYWRPCGAKRAQRRRGESRGDDHLVGQLNLLTRGTSGLPGEDHPGAIWVTNHFCTLLKKEEMRNMDEQKTMCELCSCHVSCWLWVNTALYGRSCELVSSPAILQTISGPSGGASDEKGPNLFKAGLVGSGVPPTSSSPLPRLQKGLIQVAEWGH